MPKYSIDGVDYEIESGLDLKETVDKIRGLQSHIEAQNTVGKALKENAAGVATAVGDIVKDIGPFIVGAGAAIPELFKYDKESNTVRGNFPKARDTMNEVSQYYAKGQNDLIERMGGPNLDVQRESGGYHAAMAPIEAVAQAAGKYMGAATYYAGGSPEAIDSAGAAGDVGTGLVMAGSMLHGSFRANRVAREKAQHEAIRKELSAREEARARSEMETRAAEEAELARMQQPYTKPSVEKVQTLQDRTIDAQYEGIVNPEFARPQTGRLKIEDPHTIEEFPFNTKAHENAVPFPLRQEILDTKEVREITDSYRSVQDEINARHDAIIEEARGKKASDAAIAKLEEARNIELKPLKDAFGEYMSRYGAKDAPGATGARRKLYDPNATALPVERSQGLRDRPRHPADKALREPTPFDILADLTEPKGTTKIPYGKGPGKRQQGYVDFRMLQDGYKFVRKVVDKLGEPVTLIGFTARAADKLDHLPEHIRDYIKQESAHSADSANVMSVGRKEPNPKILRTIALDKDGKPIAMTEFRPKGEYLESDWTQSHTPGRGIVNQIYDSIRKEGSDIRRSAATTREGKAMWDAFIERESRLGRNVPESDYRPVLERLNKGPGRFSGGKESGGIKLTTPAGKFKEWAAKNYPNVPEEVVKGAWERMNEKKPKVEVSHNEHKIEALKEIPGIKGVLDKYTEPLKSIEELSDAINKEADLGGGAGTQSLVATLPGSQGVVKVFDRLLLKAGTVRVRRAIQESDKQTSAILYDKKEGLTHVFKELSKKDKAEWITEAIKLEGKPGEVRFENPKIQAFHDQLRTTLDKLFDYGNEIRALQGLKPLPKRENYLPAKFIGEFYTVITRTSEKTGLPEVIGWYSGRTRKEVLGFKDQLETAHPEWTVGEVLEKTTGYNKEGQAHAYNMYHQLQSVVESGSAEAKVLSGIVERYQSNQAKRTAGFYQHQKAKKGILGSSGRNEFRTGLENSNEMMRTIQMYTHQLFEYGEMAKIDKDIQALLNKEKFPGKKNSQEYLQWHYNRAKGIEGAITIAMQDAVNSVAHVFGMSGSTIRGMGVMGRSALMWELLSFHNGRFLLAQVLQPHQFVTQAMTKMKADGLEIGPGDMLTAWAKGTAATFKRGKNHPDIQWAIDNRVIDQSILEDINSRFVTRDVNAFSLISGNQSIRWTESLARKQVFVTYMSLLRDKLPLAEARQVAKEWTEWSMTDYRPAEMPKVYRDAGLVGAMASPLARFKHNALGQIAHFIAEGIRHKYEPKHLVPLFVAVLVQQNMAGLMGMYGREDLDFLANVAKEFFGYRGDNVTETILKSENPSYITHGFTSKILGGDMSQTLGMSKALPDEHSMFPLVSKSMEIIKSAFNAVKERTNASAHQLAKSILPTSGVAQMPLEWATRQGDIVTDPKRFERGDVRRPDDMTSKEWLLRLGTLRSIEESKEKAALNESRKNDVLHSEDTAILMKRAYEAYKDGEGIDKFMKKAAELDMTPSQFRQKFHQYRKEQITTERERRGGLPPKTMNQYRRYRELQDYK